MYCEVRVQDHLSEMWLEWLDSITITNLEGKEALLVGPVRDQAMLLGLLNRLHALNIQILSITYGEGPSHSSTG